MALPLRTRLFWFTVARLGGVSMLQLPAEKIPAVRERRRRALKIPLAWLVTGRTPTGVDIRDRRISIGDGVELDLRVYRPESSDGNRLPLVLNFHGGGWVGGDPRQSEWWCASIARDAGVVVASVDYRLAPEHRFPVPAEDCYAATRWAVAHAAELGADAGRLAVMGDSAGGNLAAVVCLMARDRAGDAAADGAGSPSIGFQLLIYPAVELVRDFPSAFANAHAPVLTKKDMDNAPALYCASATDMIHPYASPLRAELHDLPPALIQTAEFDPLRDQGSAYAAALRAAGVEVQLLDYRGAVHGYISLPGVSPRVKEALADAVAALRRHLGAPGNVAGGPSDGGAAAGNRTTVQEHAGLE